MGDESTDRIYCFDTEDVWVMRDAISPNVLSSFRKEGTATIVTTTAAASAATTTIFRQVLNSSEKALAYQIL